MKLSGQTAIVTGAAVRIGRAIATGLSRQGMNLLLHYGQSAAEARQLQRELRDAGKQVETVQADFRDPVTAAGTVFDAVRRHFGHATVLVNSAAIFEPAGLLETTGDLWDRQFAINLKAPAFLCQAFARQVPMSPGFLAESDETSARTTGCIVNIVDWRAERPDPDFLAYSLTKSGLASLTTALAKSLAPRIRVNAVAPGAILPAPGASEEEFRRRGRNNPLQRTGDPEQITQAVLYLLQADFVTGEVLTVSGGEQL